MSDAFPKQIYPAHFILLLEERKGMGKKAISFMSAFVLLLTLLAGVMLPAGASEYDDMVCLTADLPRLTYLASEYHISFSRYRSLKPTPIFFYLVS